ncbi:excalibur calcium-binding domain-containing protein [Neorhizobium sp. DAR64860/K0K1]|uniref:excalibur calcium-binding domain-containing protein n=1 Tax=unclassified Neorhizobium TaxID=2629175 RepID=UPI003D296FC3
MKRFVILVAMVLLAGAAQAKTCKDVSSCEEAVILWCEGYSRADADRDGIPCETVCHSLRDVQEIQSQVGCRLR